MTKKKAKFFAPEQGPGPAVAVEAPTDTRPPEVIQAQQNLAPKDALQAEMQKAISMTPADMQALGKQAIVLASEGKSAELKAFVEANVLKLCTSLMLAGSWLEDVQRREAELEKMMNASENAENAASAEASGIVQALGAMAAVGNQPTPPETQIAAVSQKLLGRLLEIQAKASEFEQFLAQSSDQYLSEVAEAKGAIQATLKKLAGAQ